MTLVLDGMHLVAALVSVATLFIHRAINNTLNKLAEVAPDTPAIKIGRATRADDLAVENYEYFDPSPDGGDEGRLCHRRDPVRAPHPAAGKKPVKKPSRARGWAIRLR